MPSITRDQVHVPADVPAAARETYIDNYMKATRGTGRLMLFACDQKIEHLNDDFYGEGIAPDDAEPEHLFRIGSQGVCGVLAGQRGLIAQYAADYPDINYLVKMNSKTHLVKTSAKDPAKHQDDPYSPQLYDIQTVLDLRDNGVNVVGVGYTIYLGSEYESQMMIGGRAAHRRRALGRPASWCCGSTRAAGRARREGRASHRGRRRRRVCLGADFVKVNPPKGDDADVLGREAQGGRRGGRPHRPRVRRRLDRGRADVPHRSCGSRSTWAARRATRPGATSTSARSTRPSG